MLNKLKGLAQGVATRAANTDFARKRLMAAANESELARYGQLEDLQIDLAARELSVSLRLHGEPQPIALTVRRYEILGDGDHMVARFQELQTDREWLQNLSYDHVVGKDFPIPPEHASTAAKLRALLI